MTREKQDELITEMQEKLIELINEELQGVDMMEEAVFLASTALAGATAIVVVSQIPSGGIAKASVLIESYVELFREMAEQVLEDRKAELTSEVN